MTNADTPNGSRERVSGLVSLAMTYHICPDNDYVSTVSNVEELFGVDDDDRCWEFKAVPMAMVSPFQLADDPDDIEGEAKIEGIRASIRDGVHLAPVFLVHEPEPGTTHPYYLIEGMHRFTARYREESKEILAWVGHFNCCDYE